MVSRIRIVLSALTLALLVYPMAGATLPAVSAAPRLQGAAFQPSECMFALPLNVEEGREVECGYLTVPEEHANPTGPTLELAVAVLKPTSGAAQPDPLFFAQGGPGGSTIDTYAEILLTTGSDLRADREIVLFDQRGTLYSEPALMCTEIDELTDETLDDHLTHEENERLYQVALAECRARLANRQVNLSAFDSVENAHDIEDLRLALGYDQINLYGVSYGTLLALHYMRLYPASLRSVILDAVLPTQTNFILNVVRTQDEAFSRMFAACRADAACNRSYPDLERVFLEVAARLDETPARVEMTDFKTNRTFENVVINGEIFINGVFQMLYSSGLVKMLPRMIYDAQRGDFRVFARILSIFIFDRTISYGMYYSVLCAEDNDFSPDEQDLTGIRPQIAAIEGLGPEEFKAACEIWDVEALGADVDDPVVSDIPTLLLSGGFDPITPAGYAEQVAANLTTAYHVVVPSGGHGQALDGDCPNRIILDFLGDPHTSPDTACVQAPATPDFYTPDRIVDLPVVLDLLNLQGPPTLATLALLLAVLFLWTAALIFPIAWLVNRFRRSAPAAVAAPAPEGWPPTTSAWDDRPLSDAPPPDLPMTEGRAPLLSHIAGWLPVLGAVLLTVFLTLLVITMVNMVSENDNRLFYGLPGATRLYFLLPLLFALLSLLMLVVDAQLWSRGAGGLARRLYYTLLTLAALLAVLMLAYLGMLTAIF